ncbi:unnamed protein product [Camellia sinensis]
MASSLRRSLSLANPHRYSLLSSTRSFSSSSSDALVETKPGEVGIVSGIPQEHLRRRVVIYSPARTATQQGSGKVGRWKINFLSTQNPKPKARCFWWENPLMGWTSTGDPYANVGDAGLSFDSEEAAKAFAEKHGWEYVRTERMESKGERKTKIELSRHTPLLKVKAYADKPSKRLRKTES